MGAWCGAFRGFKVRQVFIEHFAPDNAGRFDFGELVPATPVARVMARAEVDQALGLVAPVVFAADVEGDGCLLRAHAIPPSAGFWPEMAARPVSTHTP